MIRATVRLQFHKDFTLDDGAELVPYMAGLGASHLYASPLLKARPGSTHGYDIVDHHTINPELGGEDALRRMVRALRSHGMGLILDIVPNHMGVGGSDNAWWLDVLEWGRASPYANYFDIDWDPPDATLRNKLLAPFLGAPYGDSLAAGDLKLRFDPDDGRLFVSAYDEHRFPLDPRTYSTVLRGHVDTAAFDRLGVGREGRQRAEGARAALRAQAGAVDGALAAYDCATPAGQEAMHKLLERQNYRLAWWRAAADEINWRRFFDITSLAGVRQEEPGVFEDTHAKVLALYAEGLIDGVRIDHVDGLADPRSYCRKLRRQMQTHARERPPGLPSEDPIIWIEKILAPHETLLTDWLTDGTTGYDFMDEVAGVLHDPAGEARLTEIWTTHTGRPGDFEEEARPARRQIVREILFSELFATSAALHRIARRDLRTRDHTLTAIRRVLQEVLVHFPVYRIYAGIGGISETDRRVLDWATAGARRTIRSADHPLLDLMDGWLSGAGMRETTAGPRRQERLRAMVRFQQLSAPTAAKSIEDTAFYRYGRLLSRNEVGSEPSRFALAPAAFHAANRDRRKNFPRALLATATHDHKRGEDTRIRLAVLSEIPEEWDAALARWTRLNASLRREIDGLPAPDGADELMLYQMLVAAWPLDLSPDDAAGVEAFRERVAGWQVKALREAKRRTGWTKPAEDYEAACADFLAATLDPARPARVVHEIAAFAQRLAVPGAVNGLAQTALRLTSPGVPDLYQGTEYWDFSLVDPDNRRPVDWADRQTAQRANAPPDLLLPQWRDGRVKQAVIARALGLRQRAPGLFAAGSYLPIQAEGPRADHILAFARVHEGHAAICVVTRLSARLLNGADVPLVPSATWAGTNIVIPRHLVTRRYGDVLLSREEVQTGRQETTPVLSGTLAISDVLARLPVAVLEVQ
jgi:(1->4)-alpha-D-glucan 1-alpha-D-glucosylmutase